jgi:hypothetical protein
MKKDGTIIFLDTDEEYCKALCKGLLQAGHKNECVWFTNAAEAAGYLRDNLNSIFILLQSTNTQGIEIANTRNMVYMHESFDTTMLPYMLLILTQPKHDKEEQHTFVHCYYKPDNAQGLPKTLSQVVHFWKEQVFPPKIRPFI